MHLPVSSAEVEAALTEAARLLPDTERARHAISLLDGDGDEDFASWCARGMARLLGDAGIVILEPWVLAPLAGDALARLVEDATPIRKALQRAGHELEAAGLPAPLAVKDVYAPLFVRREITGPRERATLAEDGRVRLGRDGPVVDPVEVAKRLRERPDLGSGDVVGRVFVQNRLLPVLAYVGGPTELAYLAQIRAAHEAVGARFPLAVPRPEAAWVDARTEKAVAAFGLTVGEVLASPDRPPPVDERGPGIEAALDAWRTRVIEPPEDLTGEMSRGAESTAALRRAVRRLETAFERASKDVRAARARDAGVGADRWARVREALMPRGRPQERGLSALSVVARHGTEAFREGLRVLDPLAPGYHILHVS
jgi:uncharacterized protein YllA (UPF0747 family)